MIVEVLLAVLGAAQPLPEGFARYRVEIAGARVGVAALSAACHPGAEPRCELTWESRLRLPAASGSALRTRRIHARLDGAGRVQGSVGVEVDGIPGRMSLAQGALPLSAAELVLVARGGGCIDVEDEETARTGQACGERAGAGPAMKVTALGTVEEVLPGTDGFPEVLEIPAQRTRFVRDPDARLPDTPPPLEARVGGPPEGQPARRFCGRELDPPSPKAVLSAFPKPQPDGKACRAQAAAYAAAARRAGLPARIALGVAQDGRGFVWHAWVEVKTAGAWIPVDPAFGQLPAKGPRFTIARHQGDPAGLAEAGRAILPCWGKAQVE
jgi:hypothetical protein